VPSQNLSSGDEPASVSPADVAAAMSRAMKAPTEAFAKANEAMAAVAKANKAMAAVGQAHRQAIASVNAVNAACTQIAEMNRAISQKFAAVREMSGAMARDAASAERSSSRVCERRARPRAHRSPAARARSRHADDSGGPGSPRSGEPSDPDDEPPVRLAPTRVPARDRPP
jgi:hypothetical protein